MNDFTKEELCALRDSRCYHMDDSYPSHDKLFMKLQSIIENYCDHKETNFDDGLYYCDKCGVFIK